MASNVKELDVLLRYAQGTRHDIVKYLLSSKWERLFYQYRSIANSDFSSAKASFSVFLNSIDEITARINQKDIRSAEFKSAVRSMREKMKKFDGEITRFRNSSDCTAEIGKKIDAYLIPFRLVYPLSNVWLEGKLRLNKTHFKLKPLVKELESCFRDISGVLAEGGNVSFNIEGNPTVYADRAHLSRAMFNLYHDAVTHRLGENVEIRSRVSKGNLLFSTTNVGRRLQPQVIKRIGVIPYESVPGDKFVHGFGKIAAKDVARVHGGKFLARNTNSGFKISIAIPQQRLRRRIA